MAYRYIRKGIALTRGGSRGIPAGGAEPLRGTPRVPIPQNPKPNSVAVLPFINLTGRPRVDALGRRISERISRELRDRLGFAVAELSTRYSWTGEDMHLRELGHRLGAELVLLGNLLEGRHVVRASAQLLHAGSGRVAWCASVDYRKEAGHTAEREVVARVVAEFLAGLESWGSRTSW